MIKRLLLRITPSSLKSWLKSKIINICRSALRTEITSSENRMFWRKIFEIAPLSGDYVEFGVYKGGSMIAAHVAAKNWVDRLLNGRADHLVSDCEALHQRVRKLWDERRFVGFDSFEGMPESKGVDSQRVIWPKGTFNCSVEEVKNRLVNEGISDKHLILVKGFFNETLTEITRTSINLKKIAVAHIDSDLYESALLALNFITPMLQNGTVIIFDEWFAYRGHPLMGEQKAFREWQTNHSDWLITEYATHGPYAKSFIVNRREIPQFSDHLAEILE